MPGSPEYLICQECENPTYDFEHVDGAVSSARCPMCGNDDPSKFVVP